MLVLLEGGPSSCLVGGEESQRVTLRTGRKRAFYGLSSSAVFRRPGLRSERRNIPTGDGRTGFGAQTDVVGRSVVVAMLVAVAALATSSVTSAAPGNITPPSVSASSYRVGATLYADPGTWSGNPTSYSFQWKKCKLDPSYTCQNIAGATGPTHVVTAGDGVWNRSRLPARALVHVRNPDHRRGDGIRRLDERDGPVAARLDAAVRGARPVGGSTQTFGAPPAGVPEIDGAISPVPTCEGNTGPLCTNPLGVFNKIGGRYSLPEGGTLTSFSAYFGRGEAPQQFIPAVYQVDASGLPTRLVVGRQPDHSARRRTAADWFTASLASAVQVPAGTLCDRIHRRRHRPRRDPVLLHPGAEHRVLEHQLESHGGHAPVR